MVLQHTLHFLGVAQPLDMPDMLAGFADEALKEAQPEASKVVPVAEETEKTPELEHAEHMGHADVARLHTEALPVEEAAAAKEDAPVEAPAHEEEAVPVVAASHEMEAGPVEASAHKKAVPEAEEVAGPVEAAAHKEAALPVSVPGPAQLPEEHALDREMPAAEEQPHQVEPEQAPADVEEPIAEPKVRCTHAAAGSCSESCNMRHRGRRVDVIGMDKM